MRGSDRCAFMAGACLLVMASSAEAQTVKFDIAAGPLADALNAYVHQSRRQLIYRSDEMKGVRSGGARGALSSDQALRSILDGTGFLAEEDVQGNAVAIVRKRNSRSPSTKPMPPLAEQDAKPSSEQAEEIIVTAQRREQSLQDVPVSVTVASGEALARANISNLEQLSTQTPNVRISQAPASDQLHIRGAGSGLNAGFEQSVATFVDGAYRGRSRSSRAALFDVDRVEVLKGPQTTFFGNNAIAGAFSITTRKPGNSSRYNAAALYSPNDGEYKVEGGLDVPLANNFAVRLSARASGMDGYIFNSKFNRDEPRLRDWIGRISALWQVSDSIRSSLRVDFIRNRDTGTYSAELLNCPPPAQFGAPRGQCLVYLNAAGGAVDDRLDYHSATGASRFRYNAAELVFSNDVSIGNHTLSLATTYFRHRTKDLFAIVPVPTPGLFGAPTPFALAPSEKYSQFTQEIRLSSPTGQRTEYMLGGYFLAGNLDLLESVWKFAEWQISGCCTGPLPHPATHSGYTSVGWPGGGAGRCGNFQTDSY